MSYVLYTIGIPIGVINYITQFTDEIHINRAKYIANILLKCPKFRLSRTLSNDGRCLFGRNNIHDLSGYKESIFGRKYRAEIFMRSTPNKAAIKHTLQYLEEAESGCYNKVLDNYTKRIAKACRRVIRRSSKYKSFGESILNNQLKTYITEQILL